MSFTTEIAEWIAKAPSDWPPIAVDKAERSITDTVACMIAGTADEAPARALAGLDAWGRGGQCSVVGSRDGRDAPWAALINGTAAHAFDYDDVLDPAASHVSAALVPAVLAIAEERKLSGMEVIDAYLVGVEVQRVLANAVNMLHYTKGWHTTATLGAPSAAAACARLLGLDAAGVVNALSIATSMAAGFKRQFGTDTKPLHAGLAAKSGIVAAHMAAGGVLADPFPFEGERGFFDLLAGPGAEGFGSVRPASQAATAAVDPGLWLKRYPCCASTHRPVDGLLALMKEHSLTPEDIETIDTYVSAPAIGNLVYPHPATPAQARFSMQYCLAAAAIDGDLTLQSFRPEKIARPEVAGLMARVRMLYDPDQPADMPSTVKSWATTHIQTRDGRKMSKKTVDPKGYPDNPLSEDDLQRKFLDCAAGTATAIQQSFPAWRGLRAEASVAKLCAALREVTRTAGA